MKALFITGSDFFDDTYGGPKGSYRNYLLLSEYFDVDTYTVVKKSTLRSTFSILEGFFPPTDITDVKIIKEIYNEKKYPIVFFDGSTYGELINIFDPRLTKTIVFYHNCEHDYISVRFGDKFSLKKAIYQYLNDRSERKSTYESNLRITFSKRDACRIEELYGQSIDTYLPLSIVDKYEKVESNPHKRSCLLFGPLGTANIEAFEWFVKNVSPKLNCLTIVAGKGFEQYKSWESDKVSVIGFVDSIADLYNRVSCVAIPLFSGSGMKVKTVEAMMFGKTIFGTDEAFSGYEVDYDKVGGLCNDAKEFIVKINSYMDSNIDEYNKYSRSLYQTKYSVEASKSIFKEIIGKLGLNM